MDMTKEETSNNNQNNDTRIIKYSRTIYLASLGVLIAFMIISIVLTYVLPKGHFEVIGETVNYNNYILTPDKTGINIFKGIFAPIMMFTTDGFIQPLMLVIFLLTIAGVFQTMIDCGGMQSIVRRFVSKFQSRPNLFLFICSLFFMILGACFGLFEETLLLLPMVIAVCVSLGYDLNVGFMVCTLATGIGFSVGITNPFTVVYASNIIGASVTKNIWFRILIFAIYYGLLMAYTFTYTRKKSAKNVNLDNAKLQGFEQTDDHKQFVIYLVFLSIAFVSIILSSSIPFLRDISIVVLIAVFLIGGFISGFLACGVKKTFKTFLKGVMSALPSVVMVLFAFSIKYILIEGGIIDTITNLISKSVVGRSTFASLMIIFCIILVLEFFVSSSTAKAVFVMGVLAGVLESGALAVSKELIVLIYLFSDGFTNVLFPTSPVLLIGLSMTDQSYLGWLKRSKWFFLAVFALCIGLIGVAVLISY